MRTWPCDDLSVWVGEPVKVIRVDDGLPYDGVLTTVSQLMSTQYPEITLSDGRKVGGLDCWWLPAEIAEGDME